MGWHRVKRPEKGHAKEKGRVRRGPASTSQAYWPSDWPGVERLRLVPVMIMIMIMVVIVVMTVPPVPICLLLVVVQLAKVSIVPMIFDDPLMVVDGFVIVPAVIVVVVRVVHAIASTSATRGQGWREKSDGQQE